MRLENSKKLNQIFDEHIKLQKDWTYAKLGRGISEGLTYEFFKMAMRKCGVLSGREGGLGGIAAEMG